MMFRNICLLHMVSEHDKQDSYGEIWAWSRAEAMKKWERPEGRILTSDSRGESKEPLQLS
jgi:hypothetical protein